METAVEENGTLFTSEEANVSNLTGRDAASVPGMAVTYCSLFLMAVGPIVVGSIRSVTYHCVIKSSGKAATDRIKMQDAALFPVYASVALFGLYLFFKFLPKEYVNFCLSIIFVFLGVSALTRALSAIISPFFPEFVTSRLTYYHMHLTAQPPRGQDKEETRLSFNTADIYILVMSLLLAATYFITKQWILNNMLGLAFSVNAVEMISLDSVKVGCLLLGGLFVYDIFWVFGTDVMVTVAKGLEAPIKLMFPLDLLENGLLADNFGMLGLGDIVVPGLYIALLCRFDFNLSNGRSKLYFYTGFLAYILGLGTTIAVMHIFKAAQPALLYLVPFCLGLPFLVAAFKGDFPALFKYVDYPDTETTKETAKEDDCQGSYDKEESSKKTK